MFTPVKTRTNVSRFLAIATFAAITYLCGADANAASNLPSAEQAVVANNKIMAEQGKLELKAIKAQIKEVKAAQKEAKAAKKVEKLQSDIEKAKATLASLQAKAVN